MTGENAMARPQPRGGAMCDPATHSLPFEWGQGPQAVLPIDAGGTQAGSAMAARNSSTGISPRSAMV
jgi:hypothetical protein